MAPGILVAEPPFRTAPAKEPFSNIEEVQLSPEAPVKSTTIEPKLLREPLKLTGLLDVYDSFNSTPFIGTEFPTANVVDWMRAPNSDDLIRELGITISRRGVCVFRSQTELTDELQKELIDRLGILTGKPQENYLHVHPLNNFNDDLDKNLNVITTDKGAHPAEDLFKNQSERALGPRGGWHSDIGYEPNPADYTCLKITKKPQMGGDTLFASSCEIYDNISSAYRSFLETLTATFWQPRYASTSKEKGIKMYSDPRGAPANTGTSMTTHHPVVRTNPVTGWKSLYGVGTHMKCYDGLSKDESNRLHDWFLQMIVENQSVQCRHRWNNLYDIAIWDNRSTSHTATLDYAGLGARTGHRAVGIGEVPYFDPASLTRRQALDVEKIDRGEATRGDDGQAENLLAME